ncbi:ABC transporter ATP-binding protein [Desulfonatronum sp. SC1]|uniref:ABC transporter ATP-binding protein n=1 Tax=Desulfonatronum sp. SC1 TaxID=2109626 RepID=UPI000D3258D3|nr:ABC transporter ATP-binding protein [Desulfonatronum sp. SC1]PTN33797.1 hypothetical protein C6366_14005 [Desulfonatronum sp. SC1]
MQLFLTSLFSRKDNAGGLALLDLDRPALRHVQLVDMTGLPVRHCHLRGLHWTGSHLYAVATNAMFVFRLCTQGRDLFALERTVILPEWVLGPSRQANLHTVFADQSQDRVFVPFNAQCALDQFDMQGRLVQRRFFWEIAPDLFPLPSKAALQRTFTFGVVRHLFQDPMHGPVLVMSYLNNGDQGALIALDSGKLLLRMNFNPHGTVLYDRHLYVSNIQAGEIVVYPWPVSEPDAPATRTIAPALDFELWPESVQYVRGMAAHEQHLIYGVCHPAKVAPTQIMPRLVEFDLESGTQKKEHFLPTLEGLHAPQVYALHNVPDRVAGMVEAWLREEDREEPMPLTEPVPEALLEQPLADRVPAETVAISRDDLSRSQDVQLLPDPHPPAIEQVRAASPPTDAHSAVLVFDNVGLFFPRKRGTWFFRDARRRPAASFWALRNVSFALHEGETIALIGRNGSGKSTLAMLCCGVYQPDEGRVDVWGRVQLLALGVGFKPELSGRDNVYVSASLLGLSRARTKILLPEIEAFAELGEFMDQPVRTYSSGMKSRLGFAVATAVDPEILILDETMSVGDKAFQTKAAARMSAMREKAKSVLLVSHSPEQIKNLCSRALWLEQGRLLMDDNPDNVLNAYEVFCQDPEKWLEQHSDNL